MCGIAGALFVKTEDLTFEKIEVIPPLSLRGKDHIGSYETENFKVFHSLLQMQSPLNDSLQPRLSHDQNWVVAFNGEIYNWQDFGNYSSEAEMLVEEFSNRGTHLFSHLKGPFAIALYHIPTKKLTLARDYFGEKPLFFSSTQNSFLFASNTHTLRAMRKINEIDVSRVEEIMNLRFNSGFESIWQNICKVKPGTILEISLINGSIESQEKALEISNSEKDADLLDFFKTAVQKQEKSIHNSALLYSSGIDSNGILAVAQKKPRTYHFNALGAPREDITADTEISATDINLRQVLLEAQSQLSEPILDSSLIQTVILAKNVKEKLVFSGDGADELMYGYAHHFFLYNFLKMPKIVQKIIKVLLPFSLPFLSSFFKYIYKKELDQIIVRKLQNFLDFYITHGFFYPEHFHAMQTKDLTNTTHATKQRYTLEDLVNWEIKNWIPNYLVPRCETIFMANNKEIRLPYLDLDFYQKTKKIPVSNYFSFISNKSIFRKQLKNLIGAKAKTPKKPFVIDPISELKKDKHIILKDIEILNRFSLKMTDSEFEHFIKTFSGRKIIMKYWSLSLFLIAHLRT